MHTHTNFQKACLEGIPVCKYEMEKECAGIMQFSSQTCENKDGLIAFSTQ